MILVLLTLFVLLIAFYPVYIFSRSDFEPPNGKLTRALDVPYEILKNGEIVGTSLPLYSFSSGGGNFELHFTLPAVDDGEALAFILRSAGLEVTIGEETVYSYLFPDKFGYPSLRMYHSIPLKSSYSGKDVAVRYDLGGSSPLFLEIYYPFIGCTSSNYHYFFDAYKFPSMLMVSLIALGFLFLILSLLLKGGIRRKIFFFSLFVLSLSLSLFFCSLFAELIIGNPLIASILGLFFRSFTAFIYMLFLRENFPSIRAFSKTSLLSIFSLGIFALFPLFFLLSLFSLVRFNFIYLLLSPFISVFLILILFIFSRRKGRSSSIFFASSLLLLLFNTSHFVSHFFLVNAFLFDVLNVILVSAVFIIFIIDAVRIYTEENVLVADMNKLMRKSYHDTLSDLGNVNAYESLFSSGILKEGKRYYISFFDLDGLKKVNDLEGHQKGDLLIKAFGMAMKRNSRESDYLFRVGGDEFVCIAESYEGCESYAGHVLEDYSSSTGGHTASGACIYYQLNDGTSLSSVLKSLDMEVIEKKRRLYEK